MSLHTANTRRRPPPALRFAHCGPHPPTPVRAPPPPAQSPPPPWEAPTLSRWSGPARAAQKEIAVRTSLCARLLVGLFEGPSNPQMPVSVEEWCGTAGAIGGKPHWQRVWRRASCCAVVLRARCRRPGAGGAAACAAATHPAPSGRFVGLAAVTYTVFTTERRFPERSAVAPAGQHGREWAGCARGEAARSCMWDARAAGQLQQRAGGRTAPTAAAARAAAHDTRCRPPPAPPLPSSRALRRRAARCAHCRGRCPRAPRRPPPASAAAPRPRPCAARSSRRAPRRRRRARSPRCRRARARTRPRRRAARAASAAAAARRASPSRSRWRPSTRSPTRPALCRGACSCSPASCSATRACAPPAGRARAARGPRRCPGPARGARARRGPVSGRAGSHSLPRATSYLNRGTLTYSAPTMVADPLLGLTKADIGAMTSAFPAAYGGGGGGRGGGGGGGGGGAPPPSFAAAAAPRPRVRQRRPRRPRRAPARC